MPLVFACGRAATILCCAGRFKTRQLQCCWLHLQAQTSANIFWDSRHRELADAAIPTWKLQPGIRPGPRPFPDLSSTAAACSAETACGMFTSDGYIIGGYRYDSLQGSREIEDKVVGWRPMEYCSWACCGTWVADGFVAQLAQPTPLSAVAAGCPLVRINATDLPVDSVSVIAIRTDILQTVCVGNPNHNLTSLDKQKVSPPGTPDCPQRCLVACCKQLAIGGGDSCDLIGPAMGQYHFSQCSGTACLHCGYAFGSVEATGNEVVLLRAYARSITAGC